MTDARAGLSGLERSRGERIVDVVFARRDRHRVRRAVVSVLSGAAIYGALYAWVGTREPSLEAWSSDLAIRVHAELSQQEVEIETLPPPPEAPPAPVETARTAAAPLPRAHRLAPSKPPPPAQAGAVLTRSPAADVPLDLTGKSFVTGSARAYAGGTTSSTGTNPQAVHTAVVDPESKPGSRARAVGLESGDWTCPWPKEAEAQDIDEQIVLVRAKIDGAGRAESAELLADPGHGFGAAAIACALRARYLPARDKDGQPVRAESPPIRVRFVR